MNQAVRYIMVVAGLMGVSVRIQHASCAEGPRPIEISPREGVLLLLNGEIIQGKITRTGDYYRVVVPNGEIRMRAADVEAQCDSLEHGYQFKRANIRLGTAQEHLQLGQWCERHGLLDHAERELAHALAIEPKHPAADLLRRRIDIARRPAPPPAPAPDPAAGGVSADDLDRLVRGLPPAVMEVFSQSIQPLLLNNCTTAGCHGPQGAGRFSLLKAPFGQPTGRRLTQRNLFAAMEWIDRKDPAKSPILLAPLAPHGTAKAPVFGKHQADQYERLARWVFQAAASPDATAPPNSEGQTPGVVPATAVEPAPGAVRPAGATEPAALQASPWPFDEFQDAPAPDERQRSDPQRGPYEAPHRSTPQRGDPTQGFRPKDPFDPEVFNRRYSPEQGPGGAAG